MLICSFAPGDMADRDRRSGAVPHLTHGSENLEMIMNQWELQHLHRQLEPTMGSVLSTFVEDYNENFSYRIPSHIPMDDSSDEDEQFIVYSRVDVRIVTIDSESESNWRFVKIPRMFSFWRISRAYQTLVDSLSWSNHGSKRNGNQADYDIGKLFLVPKHQGQQ